MFKFISHYLTSVEEGFSDSDKRLEARYYYSKIQKRLIFISLLDPSYFASLCNRNDGYGDFLKPIPSIIFNSEVDSEHINRYAPLFDSSYDPECDPEDAILNLLVWFKKLNFDPNSIFAPMKEQLVKHLNNLDLGSWVSVELDDVDDSILSEPVKEFLKAYKLEVGFTQLSWRNLKGNKLFATLVARLFANSFSTDNIKQNFKMSHDPRKKTLMKEIYRRYGKQFFTKIFEFDEGTNSISVFNSTSIASHLGVRLLKLWSNNHKSIWAKDLRERANAIIINKLKQRLPLVSKSRI